MLMTPKDPRKEKGAIVYNMIQTHMPIRLDKTKNVSIAAPALSAVPMGDSVLEGS